jgi:hypothetical protein
MLASLGKPTLMLVKPWRGTTLGELQELGAWKSESMVKRYAHFAPEQLRRAADRLAAFSYTERKTGCSDERATC